MQKKYDDAVVILGNGESRKGLNLEKVKACYSVYGCNALYRDFTPDLLFAMDKPMAIELDSAGYGKTNRVISARADFCEGAEPWNGPTWMTGSCALLYACREGLRTGKIKRIFLVGMDCSSNDNQMKNNIYRETLHYEGMAQPIAVSNRMAKEVSLCVEMFYPEIKFFHVDSKNKVIPVMLSHAFRTESITLMSREDFEETL